MGSGYRTFASGEVLTSSNVMNYLMEQSVLSFASTAARDAAVTAPEEGMAAYLQDLDKLTVYTGAAWTDGAYLGAWATYTPAWTTSGSAPSIGNGTLAGRYTRVGKQVTFWASITAGSSTTYGTGNYFLSLPVQAGSAIEQFVLTRIYDSSATTAWMGEGVIAASSSVVQLQSNPGSNLANVTNTSPMSGANGDFWRCSGTYETV